MKAVKYTPILANTVIYNPYHWIMTVLQLCHTKFLHIFVIGFTFTVSPSHPYLFCTWTNFKPVLVLVLVLEHLFSSVLVLVLVLDKNKSPVLVLVLVLELLYLNPCLPVYLNWINHILKWSGDEHKLLTFKQLKPRPISPDCITAGASSLLHKTDWLLTTD